MERRLYTAKCHKYLGPVCQSNWHCQPIHESGHDPAEAIFPADILAACGFRAVQIFHHGLRVRMHVRFLMEVGDVTAQCAGADAQVVGGRCSELLSLPGTDCVGLPPGLD